MLSILRKRRSIRKYQDKKISDRILNALEETLLRAPSSRDRRPWQFFFVTDPALLKQLSACKEHGSSFLSQAPLGIVVCGDETIADTWIEDCSIAAILVQMTAQSLGLGSCWIQVRLRDTASGKSAEEAVRKTLKLPAHLRVECIVALGFPAEKKAPVSVKKLKRSVVHKL